MEPSPLLVCLAVPMVGQAGAGVKGGAIAATDHFNQMKRGILCTCLEAKTAFRPLATPLRHNRMHSFQVFDLFEFFIVPIL
jgi:hypothetical protein